MYAIIRNNLHYIFLLFVIAAGYYTGLNGEFISDDWPQIAENHHLQSIYSIPGFFTKGVWANSALDLEGHTLYRPVFLLWYFVIHAVFGPDPFWFHTSTLAVHFINAIIVFILIRRLDPRASITARTLGAVIFALHPAQTHCIAWISGGTDVVLCFFFIGAFLGYLQYRDSGRIVYLFITLSMFFVALLTKETAAVFPALIIIYDLTKISRFKDLNFSCYAAMLAVFSLYLFLKFAIVGQEGLTLSFDGVIRLGEYILLSFRYLIVPWNFPFFFEYPLGGIADTFDVIIGIAGLLAAAYAIVRIRKLWFSIFWSVITLLPPLGLAFHEHGVFAVRFLYLPITGLAIGVATALPIIKTPRNVVISAIGALSLLFIILNIIAIKDWRNDRTFYEKVIFLNPQQEGGYDGLAKYYKRNGDTDSAVKTYMLAINTIHSNKMKMSSTEKLGQLYAELGRHKESISAYESMLSSSFKDIALIGIGNNYWNMKRYNEALASYRKVLQFDQNNFLALYNYARLSEILGRFEEARIHYKLMLLVPRDPDYPEAIINATAFLSRRVQIP